MTTTTMLEKNSNQSASRVTSTSTESGRNYQVKLWSTLNEVSQILRLPFKEPVSQSNMLLQHVHYKSGQRIHTIGQDFENFHIVNSGFLKTVLIDEFGYEQGLSFPMKGDVLGIDSFHTGKYSTEAVALSDCNLIVVPYKCVVSLARNNFEFEQLIHAVISRELARKQAMVSLLGATNAEVKVVRFLLFLSNRFVEIGYSGKQFELRMTRQEIGSFLGLSLETISRSFSSLNDSGLVDVMKKSIKINDHKLLQLFGRTPTWEKSGRRNSNAKLRLESMWPNGINQSLPN